MITRAKWLTLILLTMLLSSCSYTWKIFTTTKGKRVVVKVYKNYELQHKMDLFYLFKSQGNRPLKPRYTGKITLDTARGTTYIIYDTCRISLRGKDTTYKEIFTTGLISPQNIYCQLDSACKSPPPYRIKEDKDGKPVVEYYDGWAGPSIHIGNIKLITDIKYKGTQRRFELWVNPDPEVNHGGYDVFLLELINEHANEKTEMHEFIKGAQTNIFKRGWGII